MSVSPEAAQLQLAPFRALRLRASFVGAPVANRIFARPYRSIAGRLQDWRRQRHLRLDPQPALYIHEYTSAGVSVRGIVGALELDPCRDVVLPHEGVRLEQVAELVERGRELPVNPAPILLLHRGTPALRTLVDLHTDRKPDLVFTDRGSQLHRIWRVTVPAELDELAAAVRATRAVIADGHHRYAAAQQLADEHPDEPVWHRTLVMLVDQADTPLQLGAIHRVVPGLTLDAIEEAARGRADVFRRHATRAEALGRLEHALVLHDGSSWATLAPARRGLAVVALHEELLPAWKVTDEAVQFHHTAGRALAEAANGVAILLPAPTFDQVVEAAAVGRLLPEKATSFQPKPHLGALMRDQREE